MVHLLFLILSMRRLNSYFGLTPDTAILGMLRLQHRAKKPR